MLGGACGDLPDLGLDAAAAAPLNAGKGGRAYGTAQNVEMGGRAGPDVKRP